jgi:hypothetical protein
MATESEQNTLLTVPCLMPLRGLTIYLGFSAYFLFACGHLTLQKKAVDFLNSLHPLLPQNVHI